MERLRHSWVQPEYKLLFIIISFADFQNLVWMNESLTAGRMTRPEAPRARRTDNAAANFMFALFCISLYDKTTTDTCKTEALGFYTHSTGRIIA